MHQHPFMPVRSINKQDPSPGTPWSKPSKWNRSRNTSTSSQNCPTVSASLSAPLQQQSFLTKFHGIQDVSLMFHPLPETQTQSHLFFHGPGTPTTYLPVQGSGIFPSNSSMSTGIPIVGSSSMKRLLPGGSQSQTIDGVKSNKTARVMSPAPTFKTNKKRS